MKRFYILFVLGILFINSISGQDFHYSQYESNPLYLNPALAADRMDQKNFLRFNLNYREQFANYKNGKGSNTSIASGLVASINNKFTIGEFINNNRSVNGDFNTLNMMLSGSYLITNDKKNPNNILSVGLQLGFIQKSILPQNFVFESQYSGSESDGFDETKISGENFQTQNILKFDANIGFYYRCIPTNKVSPFIGFSLYHLTQPNESIYGQKFPSPLRFNLHSGVYLKMTETITLLPQLLYMRQDKVNDLNVGFLLFYKIKESPIEPLFGTSWRFKNSIVMHFGLKTKSVIFRISYDANIDYLQQFNNRAIEFSIIYNVFKGK